MKLDYNLSVYNPVAIAEGFAKPFESCRLKAYWDVAGFPTNGWGNLLSRTRIQDLMRDNSWTKQQCNEWLETKWPEISQEQADADLERNIGKAFKSVLRLVKVSLNEYQLAALIDFTFNLGAGNLQISTLLRMINRGEIIDAADQFLRWDKAGGVQVRGLTRRCKARRDLFLKRL